MKATILKYPCLVHYDIVQLYISIIDHKNHINLYCWHDFLVGIFMLLHKTSDAYRISRGKNDLRKGIVDEIETLRPTACWIGSVNVHGRWSTFGLDNDDEVLGLKGLSEEGRMLAQACDKQFLRSPTRREMTRMVRLSPAAPSLGKSTDGACNKKKSENTEQSCMSVGAKPMHLRVMKRRSQLLLFSLVRKQAKMNAGLCYQ